MKASVKRIIWALGWPIVWLFNDVVVLMWKGRPANDITQLVMSFIWVIPLIFFKDDKERRR